MNYVILLKLFISNNLLYYSWLELKFFIKFISKSTNKNKEIKELPINKRWFEKVTFLIKNQKYSNFSRYFIKLNRTNSKTLLSLRIKVIENYIFNS
jgi:hypothetical protein